MSWIKDKDDKSATAYFSFWLRVLQTGATGLWQSNCAQVARVFPSPLSHMQTHSQVWATLFSSESCQEMKHPADEENACVARFVRLNVGFLRAPASNRHLWGAAGNYRLPALPPQKKALPSKTVILMSTAERKSGAVWGARSRLPASCDCQLAATAS